MVMEMWAPLGIMISVELLASKWEPSNGKTLDYFMKTPNKFGSIFKNERFSMDIEALIPIDLPKKVIYRRR
jgi:hypothetical protein